MRSKIFIAVLFVTTLAHAKDKHFYQTGLLSEMTSSECGYQEKSGKGFVGAIIGTDGSHKDIRQTLCQEYVLKSDKVTYRIRPRSEKKPALLPIGERVEFRIKKDRMLLHLGEDSDKEIEYNVVSMIATERSDNAKTVAEAK